MASGYTSASEAQTSLDFHGLVSELGSAELPPLLPFEPRDGTRLHYRHYPSNSNRCLILVHGSGTHSAYLAQLASSLAGIGVASVLTPDLRGHGPAPARRGDIDYIGQLEDDLADLVNHAKATINGTSTFIIGGHSSGGGLAVRFAGSEHAELASAYVLLAPFLGHDAPTVRKNSGGWAQPNVLKIVSLSILNRIGMTNLNDTQVLHFDLPEQYRTGAETLSYTYRLMTGFNPENFRADLQAVEVPLLLLVGSEDEAFIPAEFEPTVRPLVPQAVIAQLDSVGHLDLVMSEAAIESVANWLRTL